jgi:hypothetical protein
MSASSLLRIIPFAVLLGVSGCASLQPYEYNVLCRNRSGFKLTDLRISYGSFSTQFGSHLRVTEPLPPIVRVQFRTQDAQFHDRQVLIPEEVRRSIRASDLMLFIEPDLSVTVLLRTRDQRKTDTGTL